MFSAEQKAAICALLTVLERERVGEHDDYISPGHVSLGLVPERRTTALRCTSNRIQLAEPFMVPNWMFWSTGSKLLILNDRIRNPHPQSNRCRWDCVAVTWPTLSTDSRDGVANDFQLATGTVGLQTAARPIAFRR
jgi:hypothetical protein